MNALAFSDYAGIQPVGALFTHLTRPTFLKLGALNIIPIEHH